jgi:hypothetical protein
MRRALVLALTVACGSFEASPSESPDGGGDAAGGGGDAQGTDGGTGVTAKLVFVAAGLLTAPDVQKADQVCDGTIKRISGARRAVAWVYLDDLSPLQRMGTAEGPWQTPSGRPVFADRGALTSGTLPNPISEDVDGRSLGGQKAWTALNPDGGPSGLDCQRWQANGDTDEATIGIVGATNASWASGGTVTCSAAHPVLCIEY